MATVHPGDSDRLSVAKEKMAAGEFKEAAQARLLPEESDLVGMAWSKP